MTSVIQILLSPLIFLVLQGRRVGQAYGSMFHLPWITPLDCNTNLILLLAPSRLTACVIVPEPFDTATPLRINSASGIAKHPCAAPCGCGYAPSGVSRSMGRIGHRTIPVLSRDET